jgi:hypothetical protein
MAFLTKWPKMGQKGQKWPFSGKMPKPPKKISKQAKSDVEMWVKCMPPPNMKSRVSEVFRMVPFSKFGQELLSYDHFHFLGVRKIHFGPFSDRVSGTSQKLGPQFRPFTMPEKK